MSYNEDAVRAKLSALNETQESIVTVAQWVMFHRRYADKTAQLWLERLKESNPPKRVNLIYLANEVIQQSKARRKEDFVNSFSPIMPEATAEAFKGANNDVQTKIRRVIEVWRQRQIFEPSVQDAIEARVAEAGKSRPTQSRKALGGSLFSPDSAVPTELQPLVATQHALSKAHLSMTPLVQTAQKDQASLASSASTSKPPARVHAAQLGALVKALANAEAAVSDGLERRRELIAGLEKLLDANRKSLVEEDDMHASLTKQRQETEAQRRQVEDSILQGVSAGGEEDNDSRFRTEDANAGDVERPELERFTPPPVEPLSPPPAPMPDDAPPLPTVAASVAAGQIESTTPEGSPPPSTTQDILSPSTGVVLDESAGSAVMSHSPSNGGAAVANAIPPALKPVNGTKMAGSQDLESNRGVKRRKRSDDDFERIGFGAGEDALEGLDEDVVGMLG